MIENVAPAQMSRRSPPPRPDRRWVRCSSQNVLIEEGRARSNHWVCPECGHYFRLSARQRIDQLADPSSFAELGVNIRPGDPLGFVDSRPYAERLREAQQKTGERDGAVFGTATICGEPLVLAVMDFGFIGGAMGTAVGEAVTQAA